MQELFLHRVWQLGLFDKAQLQTHTGESVEVLDPGKYNLDAGPDFRQARLRIGTLEWHGDVEIHLAGKQWHQHGHTADAAYQKVILHVVGDTTPEIILRADGTEIPTLSLADRIWPAAYNRYTELTESLEPIPCTSLLPTVDVLNRQAMLEHCLLERLQRKALLVEDILAASAGNWEEASWRWLVRNMGFKVNDGAFWELALRLPWKLLVKFSELPLEREALLFGLSGLLPAKAQESWPQELQKAWLYLAHKHGLQEKSLAPVVWKFSRLRPANFPSLRLAQLAAITANGNHLFRTLIDTQEAEKLICRLMQVPSAYWQQHYHFGKVSEQDAHRMGRGSAENLLINVVVPLRVAYARVTDRPVYSDSALDLLQQLPAEKNRITRQLTATGFHLQNAADGQAAIELLQNYCSQKRCLECGIGLKILQRAAE